MDIQQIKIYRMTHIKNIAHILQFGITHSKSINANPSYVPIGDTSIIDKRNYCNVTVTNGNISANITTINLGDFIPFYFGIRMPMLYVIQNGGNFTTNSTHPADIIYVTCKIIDIYNSNIPFYFSDGHAIDAYTQFYNKEQFLNIPRIIDWNAIRAQYWGGNNNLDLKRKKQAEFLVETDIPPSLICDFGCYNTQAANYLLSFGILNDKIKIQQQAYY